MTGGDETLDVVRDSGSNGGVCGCMGGGNIVDVKGKIMVVVRESFSIILQHTVGIVCRCQGRNDYTLNVTGWRYQFHITRPLEDNMPCTAVMLWHQIHQ